MRGKRGPKTKQNIVDEILAIKKADRDNEITPKDIIKELQKGHKQSFIPSERVIYKGALTSNQGMDSTGIAQYEIIFPC